MNVKIERTHDAELVARLNEPVQRLHHERYPEYFKEYEFEPARDFFTDQLREDNWYCYIAKVDDRAVGYVLFFERHYSENPFRKAYEGIHIDQICVNDDQRGCGIGTMLMTEVEKHAKACEVSQLELNFWEKNIEADVFYGKSGFVRNMNFMVKLLS